MVYVEEVLGVPTGTSLRKALALFLTGPTASLHEDFLQPCTGITFVYMFVFHSPYLAESYLEGLERPARSEV